MAVFGSILVQKKAVHKDDRNVATSQRRDVSASYSSQSLKGKGDRNSREIGDRKSYEPGRGNQSNSDIDLEEEPVICIFLCFG